MSRHEIIRMRQETRRRKVTVATLAYLSARMLRIGFVSNDLADFSSPSPDDHIKLIVPSIANEGIDKEAFVMRDFTPRAFEPDEGNLVIDFALHETGAAVQWATSARIGDIIEIAGPRGSAIVPDDFDWYLLIGDETALPSIGRRVEGLRSNVLVTTVIAISDRSETQTFSSLAMWEPSWVTRNTQGSDDAVSLRAALAAHKLPQGDGFIWIAAETSVARALYAYLVEGRHHPKAWIKAAGYWTRGKPDSGERIA